MVGGGLGEAGVVDEAFAGVQARLEQAWRADLPDSTTDHLVLVLPSHNVHPVVLDHFGDRIPALEQRYLCCILLLQRPATRIAYVTSTAPPDDLVQSYLSLLPPSNRADAADRLTILTVGDPSPRPLVDKVLERPDLIDQLRALAGEGPALIDPWNVSAGECQLAVELDMPVFGADPRFWSLATKSGGRRLFRDLGVPLPDGSEDLASLDEVGRAITDIRGRNPGLNAVIVKLDDSTSGDGNAVISLSGLPAPGDADEEAALAARLKGLPDWYVETLCATHGIVEARIEGDDFTSPSAQLTITPTGQVVVLSTHDQLLGGHADQVYQGCRFPADREYAAEVAELASVVGRRLADKGVLGRVSVDFTAVRAGGGWSLSALEINLRKGGTTHPFATTRLLTGGHYDPEGATLLAADGQPRHYVATDNLLDPAWQQLEPEAVRQAIHEAGLGFDLDRQTGVVPHMLSCLPIDGRFGLTAIGSSPAHAEELYEAVRPTVDALT